MKPSTAIYHSEPSSQFPLALLAALTLHAIFILGIEFTQPLPPPEEPVLSLNVTLLEQIGRRTGMTGSIVGNPPTSITAEPYRPQNPGQSLAEAKVERPPVISTHHSQKAVPTKAENKSSQESSSAKPRFQPSAPSPPTEHSAEKQPITTLDATELMNRGIQLARLDASSQPEADSTRVKRIDRESMTTLEKFYMLSWERKVERVGTLNFPAEARQLKISNGPIVDVAISADGSIHSTRILRSSGYPSLDKAALRIVELAAPYAPFPTQLSRQYDILHIVRKWKFEQGRLLQQ